MTSKSADKLPLQRVGRYAIYDEIASGGMAAVHLARFGGPLGFSRVVAAKRLHPHLVDDEDFKRMFLDEARLAARIRHPNVVPTLDVLVHETEIILVMEYVHGESLLALYRAERERKTTVPVPIASAILVSVLHGLHAAHEARSQKGDPLQIVHRDVSPHNVMVGADGAVRVLDFGVAKAMQARPDTRPGTIKGKFSYLAPEVLRGENVTRQADIFSAGVVFWELVTGKKLFSGANEHERMLKILTGQYPAPSTVNLGLSAAIDRIVLRAIHPDVASRYATALDMAVEIETYLSIASQRVVSEWVGGLAAPSLDRRSELLQQIEVSHIKSVPPGAPARASDESQEAGGGAHVKRLEEDSMALPSDAQQPVRSPDNVNVTYFGGTALHVPVSVRSSFVLGLAAAAIAIVAAMLLWPRLRSPMGTRPTTMQPAPPALAAELRPTPAAPAMIAAEPGPPGSAPATANAPLPNPDVLDTTPRAAARGRPVRPVAPSRRAPSRGSSNGNAKNFLPDDL